ncbi:DNA-binding transcriptional ArsR family regulator [Nocardiopsis mwathae]|uniref:DNA-binding transcriptional ArsR family regulator n=1 Tax=Nocardiopsis mwathae TaxID=1472723 RepID=A0A7X0D5N3_9ACTN|nr:winged helix-turn-helix domain-containing protein [Nocardiopsis mwathae]MBB6172415.1 DNA-binding transcriptional ArsR family regulator [Nocardiopsis mwathae]
MLLSLHMLQLHHAGPRFRQWRLRVREHMTGRMWRLAELAPPRGYSPDFLTPPGEPGDLEDGLEALKSTPAAQVRRDLGILAMQQRLSAPVRDLAHADAPVMRGLAQTVREYFDLALAPEWESIGATVERALHAPDTNPTGAARAPGVPAPLRSVARWRGSVLEVAYPLERHLHLDGRELVLLPSFYCWRYPIALQDPELPPVIVYPVTDYLDLPTGERLDAARRRALEKLLGGTRAAVLRTIAANTYSTSELAERLGISPASASEHATVLRASGLTNSHRDRNAIRHELTDLGSRLLLGDPE